MQNQLNNEFSRHCPILKRTFALRAFNKHETEINRHYWSFKVISEYSGYLAREKKKDNQNYRTVDLFKASGSDSRRVPNTVSKWLDARDDLENWLRLSALVSALSYFETYLRQVVNSALMSDPLCRFGSSRAIDGVILLKNGKLIDNKKEIEGITKGNWVNRCAEFRKIFGDVPEILKNSIGDLDILRNIRNNVAHGFGRDLDVTSPSNQSERHPDKIKEKLFTSSLKVISDIASDIDKFLLENYIGNFELIHFYHEFTQKDPLERDCNYTKDRALQREFNRSANTTLSTEFCRGLIEYYNLCK